MFVSEELTRALERRSVRAQQVVIAAAAAALAVVAEHASRNLGVTAIAAAAAISAFAVGLVLACREVRVRSVDARALASSRRVRAVARSLERLAEAAESGWSESWRTRPPRSVLELSPEAPVIREVARRLREHPCPTEDLVTACDRFVAGSWNCALRVLDHELLRRELGRIRCTLLLSDGQPEPERQPSTPLSAG